MIHDQGGVEEYRWLPGTCILCGSLDAEEYDDDDDNGDHIGAFRLSRQGIRSNSG